MQYLKKLCDRKYVDRMGLTLFALGCVYLLSACTDVDINKHEKVNSDTEVMIEYDITKADGNITWNNPVYINLSEISEGYVIEEGGEYVISGASEKTLIIDAQDQMVKLFFDNVEIHASHGAAVNVLSASKVIITLLEGTENFLEDSPKKRHAEEGTAALYSVSDLTINGSGTLFVYGYYEDAIRTRDVLKILGGDVSVKSKQDGIRGSDGIYLINSSVSIESEGNGIVTTNIGKTNKGAVIIDSEKLSIVSGKYAVVCSENLYVKESDIFFKSVIADTQVDGKVFAEEGSFFNE